MLHLIKTLPLEVTLGNIFVYE